MPVVPPAYAALACRSRLSRWRRAAAGAAPAERARGPRGAAAAPRRPPPTSRPRRHNDALSDGVRRVERGTGGQVLSAERVPYDGRDVNRIKVVDDRGRVRVYMDDPQAAAARAATGGRLHAATTTESAHA